MKLRVRIENQEFEVEVGDLDERPIVALVDGERFEVWPESEVERRPARPAVPEPSAPPPTAPRPAPAPLSPTPPSVAPTPGGGATVRAPIPGVIVAIAVRPGSEVQPGDELCVLEAMKMRNSIRATRAGRIAQVHVTVGQHVRHQDVLLEFEA